MASSLFETVKKVIPSPIQVAIARRLDDRLYEVESTTSSERPSFDLIRASVNLMVASTLISFATSLKLPLSTTYVTFMVAMGTSLSDRAWGRDSAVYRITGVLTVIGGWFFTALMAFTVSSIFAVIIYFGEAWGVLGILALVILLIFRSHRTHRDRNMEDQEMEVFNLAKIKDTEHAISTSFEHAGILLQEVRKVLDASIDGLFSQDLAKLKGRKKQSKKIQNWANILVANIYKILRLLPAGKVADSERFTVTISTLQEIAESQRDISMRAHTHVANNHDGLLNSQIEELGKIKALISEMLAETSESFLQKSVDDVESVNEINEQLKVLAAQFSANQISRVRDQSSKTRLSILFYGLIWDIQKIAEHTMELRRIFQESLQEQSAEEDYGLKSE
jgi:Na+/phosphate symporter